MKKTVKKLVGVFALALVFLCFGVFALACGDKGKKGEETRTPATITFVEGIDDEITQFTRAAFVGDSLSELIKEIEPKAMEQLAFGGWFNGNSVVGGSDTVPQGGCTLKAKYYASYTAKIYTQNVDGEYEGKDEQGRGWYGEPFSYEQVPEHFSLSEKPNGNYEESKTQSDKLGKGESFVVYLARDKHTVKYTYNAPEQLGAQNQTVSETYYYGKEIELKAESELGLSSNFRLAGWANTESGAAEFFGGEAFTVTQDSELYGKWDNAISDLLGGSDYIFRSSHGEESNAVYLRRNGLQDKLGTLSDTNVFAFSESGEVVLDGKIVGNSFYYYKDTLENTYSAFDGTDSTMELAAHGAATYTPSEGAASNGSYELNVQTGDYTFVPVGGGNSFSFILVEKNGVLTFRTASEEAGYYAYKTGEATFDYDLIYFDGLGKAQYISEPEKEGEPLEIINGVYECEDAATQTYSLTFNNGINSLKSFIRLSEQSGTLGDYALKGVYTVGDDYAGTYGDSWNSFTLDGFGGYSELTYAGGKKTGTYTIESFESWHALSGNTIYEVTEHYVRVTMDGKDDTLLYFAEDLNGMEAVEINAQAFGRFDFTNTLFVNGAVYNDGVNSDAFITVTRTSQGGLYGTVWVGVYNEEYKVWVYQILAEANVSFSFSGNSLNDVGNSVKIDFTLDTENNTATRVGDSQVFADDANGKIELGLDGKAVFTPAGGTAQQVQYSVEEGLVYVYTFTMPENVTRSFVLESGSNGSVNVKEVLPSDVYDVAYASEERKNVYTARIIRLTEETAVLGILLDDGSYYYCYGGTFKESPSVQGEYGFIASNSALPSTGYDDVYAEYGWFLCKFGEKDGKQVFYQYDEAFDITCDVGRFETDGYGIAVFTPATGEVITGTYVFEGNIVYLSGENGKDYVIRVIDLEHFEIVPAVGTAYGFYYSVDEENAYEIFLDGMGTVLLYNGNNVRWGVYAPTSNAQYEEYELTFPSADDENGEPVAPLAYKIIVARIQDLGNIYVLQDVTRKGEFEVVENGKVGSLSGDGYLSATYMRSNWVSLNGVMQIGTLADGDYAESRQFLPDVNGKNILFAETDDSGNVLGQYVFDIVDGKAVLRTMAYGAYGLRKDGSFNKSYIYLDGLGTAVLYNETGEESERGTYSAFPERGENAYRFTGSESNFIFNTYIFDGDYAYTVYTAENDGVYVNGDWSVLLLDGFNSGTHIDAYGVAVRGEIVPVQSGIVALKPADTRAELMYFTLGEKSFKYITDGWVIADGTLLLYTGRIDNSTSNMKIPDGVTRIAEGAFKLADTAYLTKLDLNQVEIVEKDVFRGSGLTEVIALCLREIGDGAFYGCELSSVVLKDIEKIGANAFTHGVGSYVNATVFDISAVPNFAEVDINETAFAATSSGNIRMQLSVANVEAFNTLLASSLSDELKGVVGIANNSRDTLDRAVFFDFKTGNVYSFASGVVSKDINDNGTYLVASTTEYARYYMSADNEATLYAYSQTESKWVMLGTLQADADGIDLDDGVLFKNGATVELTETASKKTFEFYLSVYRSADYDDETKWDITVQIRYASYGSESVSASFDFATNEITFEDGTTDIKITSTTECAATVKGRIIVLEGACASDNSKYQIKFFVSTDGATSINEIKKYEDGYYYKATIKSIAENNENEFTVAIDYYGEAETLVITYAEEGGNASVTVTKQS